MIAAVKGWPAVFAALLFFMPPAGRAAEDLNGAARELARRTAALAGKGEPVSLAWRNLSSLGSSESGQARKAFEAALQEAGIRVSDIAPVTEVRVTLSENPSQYLLVEEARKGDESQVWIGSWKRTVAAATPTGITLEKKLICEQDEPILDVAFEAETMLVLSPSKVTWFTRQNGPWAPVTALTLTPPKAWPRDLRGRLKASGAGYRAFLPGMVCSGAAEPPLSMECKPGDEPWVLESGSRAMLLANFAAARNYFDGRVVTQTGQRKTVAPFYSAAAVEEQGRPLWLLALVDGRTQVLDASLEPVGAVAPWGSDIAGTEAHCGGGSQVLATRPGDGGEPDAIQAFALNNRAPAPLATPVSLPGPVTALWTSSPDSVLAVVRDLATGRYAAYVITVVCGS